MSNRREFPDKVRGQIVHRAMNERGLPVCEGCGLVLAAKKYHIDHTIPDALYLDKSRPLTAEDGKLLGVACCHAPKTVCDVGVIAKVKRIDLKNTGAFTRSRNLIPGSKGTRFKKKMDGRTELR